jgi:solute carrier family 25 thiamine pyrophosphate transporter 19
MLEECQLIFHSLFKAAPASAVTMWTYERVLHILLGMEEKAKESI